MTSDVVDAPRVDFEDDESEEGEGDQNCYIHFHDGEHCRSESLMWNGRTACLGICDDVCVWQDLSVLDL